MFAENGHSDDDFQQDLITEETVFAERLFSVHRVICFVLETVA